jgi:phage baseplate assembly protein W
VNLDFPYHFDGKRRTAIADDADHVRDLIELVLFTVPGERVHRPTFGSGVLQLVFAPASAELAATTRFLVQGALEEWLASWIAVEAVEVESDGPTLRVKISYTIRKTGERRVDEFVHGEAGS